MSGTGILKYTLSDEAMGYVKETARDYFNGQDNKDGISLRQFRSVLNGEYSTPTTIRRVCKIIGIPDELWDGMIVTRRKAS